LFSEGALLRPFQPLHACELSKLMRFSPFGAVFKASVDQYNEASTLDFMPFIPYENSV